MALGNQNTIVRHLAKILMGKQFSFIRRLQKAHPKAEIYLVGGSVRDALLGRAIKDFDFVVRDVPIKKIETSLRTLGSVNIVGRTFGVLKFTPKELRSDTPPNQHSIDIALPRTEHTQHHTGHYRDFTVQSDWRLGIDEDLSRRDFTMNAIAFDCVNHEFLDPFGGIKDIQKKIIRCVGAPRNRFTEDYSRMLRAIRFSCQLGFTLEHGVHKELLKLFPNINKKIRPFQGLRRIPDANTLRVVPYEIIARELSLALCAHPLKALELFDTFGVYKALMPEILAMKNCPQPSYWHNEGDVWTHTKLCFKALVGTAFKKEFGSEAIQPLLLWAVLFHDIGKPSALKTPEKDGVGRIRFDGHDRIGAITAKKIAETLRLHSVKDMHIDTDDLWWLVHYHLIMLNTDLSMVKNITLEKYFFRDPNKGLLLRQLIFVDSLGSKRRDGMSSLESYRALKRRLKNFESQFKKKNRLPPAIINGDEIMNALHIPPGPLVGKYILQLREEQLAQRVRTKRQAIAFLKHSQSLQY